MTRMSRSSLFLGSLRPSEQAWLADDRWSASDMVFPSLTKLVLLGLLVMEIIDRNLKRGFGQLHGWHFGLEVAMTTAQLKIGGSSALEFIAEPSHAHGVTLLTHEQFIKRSKLVPLT